MEKQTTTSVQQKKGAANQSNKAKKKAVKVVYISNPMKVKANSTADFRALVQELTGRHANPSKYTTAATEDHTADESDFVTLPALPPAAEAISSMASASSSSEATPLSTAGGNDYDVNYDEDVGTPQLIDNYAVFSPTTMFGVGDLHDYGAYGKI